MRGAPEPHAPLPSCSKRHAVAGQGGARRRSPCAWGRMGDVDTIPGGVTPFLWIYPARITSSRYQMWRRTLVRAQARGQTGIAAPEPARLRRCECEFGFSGVGTDRAVVDALLGREAFDARLRIASEIFVRYVAFAQSGDPASREAVVHADLPANQMDAEIGELSRKYSRVISEVFRGKQPPQTIKWSPNGQFEIGP